MFAVTLSASDNIARHTRTRNPMSPLSCSTSQQTSALRGAVRSCVTMAGVRQVIGKDPLYGDQEPYRHELGWLLHLCTAFYGVTNTYYFPYFTWMASSVPIIIRIPFVLGFLAGLTGTMLVGS